MAFTVGGGEGWIGGNDGMDCSSCDLNRSELTFEWII